MDPPTVASTGGDYTWAIFLIVVVLVLYISAYLFQVNIVKSLIDTMLGRSETGGTTLRVGKAKISLKDGGK
jgi:hypothetical protein